MPSAFSPLRISRACSGVQAYEVVYSLARLIITGRCGSADGVTRSEYDGKPNSSRTAVASSLLAAPAASRWRCARVDATILTSAVAILAYEYSPVLRCGKRLGLSPCRGGRTVMAADLACCHLECGRESTNSRM